MQVYGAEEPEGDPLVVDGADHSFAVCPAGGCEAGLTDEEKTCFRQLHRNLTALIKGHSPARKSIATPPLVLHWASHSQNTTVSMILAFRTYTHAVEAVLLELEPAMEYDAEPPFTLSLKPHAARPGACCANSDLAVCVALARQADDWTVSSLTFDLVGGSLAEFACVSKQEFTQADLDEEARQIREEERALRAARLARRGARQGPARRRPRARMGQAAADTDLDASSDGSRASEESGFAEQEQQEEETEEAEQERQERLPEPGIPRPLRSHLSRAIPWGPFQLAPIVPQGGQTGWGAICGLHRDRGVRLSCKKAVSLGRLDHSDCIIRLKRWLLAGLADDTWPRHNMRSHHVRMGGPLLQDFAAGETEELMDARVLRMGGS